MIQTVRTYDRLRKLANAWADGNIGLLVVVGSAGNGKSQTLKSAAAGTAAVIEGGMSAIGLYEQAFLANNSPVMIDDIDALYQDRNSVMLLKCLCQSDPLKRLTWRKASAYLEKREIPNEFQTSSTVCIVGNEWRTLNKNVAAIVDRGLKIEFCPSPEAIHEEVGKWFGDREIYDHIGRLLPASTNHSMRNYVVCSELKRVGEDWKEALRETLGIEYKTEILIKVTNDPSLEGRERQALEFERLGGGSRATFFRDLKKLLAR